MEKIQTKKEVSIRNFLEDKRIKQQLKIQLNTVVQVDIMKYQGWIGGKEDFHWTRLVSPLFYSEKRTSTYRYHSTKSGHQPKRAKRNKPWQTSIFQGRMRWPLCPSSVLKMYRQSKSPNTMRNLPPRREKLVVQSSVEDMQVRILLVLTTNKLKITYQAHMRTNFRSRLSNFDSKWVKIIFNKSN